MEEGRQSVKVHDKDGLLGWLYPDEQPKDGSEILIRLENGETLRLPPGKLQMREDGSAYVP